MTTVALTARELEAFWAKVDKSGTCWTWTGCTRSGYGIARIKRKSRQAHRISYEIHTGPIPDGMDIDHKCFTRSCVNPAHLRAVTRKQNNEHQISARRDSKTGIRGVSWMKKSKCWVARVNHNGKLVYCGYFHDIKEAEAAVIAKRNELFTHNDVDRLAA